MASPLHSQEQRCDAVVGRACKDAKHKQNGLQTVFSYCFFFLRNHCHSQLESFLMSRYSDGGQPNCESRFKRYSLKACNTVFSPERVQKPPPSRVKAEKLTCKRKQETKERWNAKRERTKETRTQASCPPPPKTPPVRDNAERERKKRQERKHLDHLARPPPSPPCARQRNT